MFFFKLIKINFERSVEMENFLHYTITEYALLMALA